MQQHQYRAYVPQVAHQVPQQMTQRSPHAPNQRRGGIGPMMPPAAHSQQQHPPPTQAQMQQQQQAMMHAQESAKRRSRKPTDKNMPDGVEESIIDPEVARRYKDLREVERRLDAIITRKRMDAADNQARLSKLQKTLRIWISNTVEDQAWQGNDLNVDAFDFTPSMEPSFRVKIEGRLLDDEDQEENGGEGDGQDSAEITKKGDKDPDTSSTPSKVARARFSHFFKSLTVDCDSRLRNGNELSMEWKKPEAPVSTRTQAAATAPLPPAADFDEITFKRNGDDNINITINLHRHDVPEKYQLTPELADVIDMKEATQQEAVMGLWEYVRLGGLQEDEEKRNFRCDELLKKVVKRGDIGYIPLLNEYVTQHLNPLPPVQLQYTIRVDEEFYKDPQPTVYDVQVSVEDPAKAQLHEVLNKLEYAELFKNLGNKDDQLARIVQAISVSKAKHSFLSSLSEDPANFVRNWLSSQKRDIDVIMGESTRTSGEAVNADEWRKGGANSVWATHNARESVNALLAKQR